MFVTIQLKNPSQQDRLSQARQIDAGVLVLSSLPGDRSEEQGPRSQRAVGSGAGRAGGGALSGATWPGTGTFPPKHPSRMENSDIVGLSGLPNCPGLSQRGQLVTQPVASPLPLASEGDG